MSEKLPKQKTGSRMRDRLIQEKVRVGETYCVTVLSGECLEVKSGKKPILCYGMVVGNTSVVFRAVSPVLLLEWQGRTPGRKEVVMLENPFLK